jgi:hypothetical protein
LYKGGFENVCFGTQGISVKSDQRVDGESSMWFFFK